MTPPLPGIDQIALGSIVPPVITVPMAAVMMLLVLVHAAATWRATDEPLSRRRIRLSNACVMMLTLPLLTVGFSLLDHRAHPREWTLVWLSAMALLAVNICLAMLDMANSLRLVRRARLKVVKALASLTSEAAAIEREGKLKDAERGVPQGGARVE